MLCFSTVSNLILRKFFEKIKIGFQRNKSTTSQTLTIKEVCAKNIKATLLFINFSLAFDSTLKKWNKYYLYIFSPKKLTALMMLYSKAMVCSHDGDADFFNIAARVLQGDTLASYLLIIYLH